MPETILAVPQPTKEDLARDAMDDYEIVHNLGSITYNPPTPHVAAACHIAVAWIRRAAAMEFASPPVADVLPSDSWNISNIQERLLNLDVKEEQLKKTEHELGLKFGAVAIERAILNLRLFQIENDWKK